MLSTQLYIYDLRNSIKGVPSDQLKETETQEMAWLSFLKSKDFDPTDFEKQLELISRKIATNERGLSKVKYQERALKRFIKVYGISGYIVLISYVIWNASPRWYNVSRTNLVWLLAVPIVIVGLVKSVTRISSIRHSRKQAEVERLQFEHESKIEELKEKTKFSSTQALLSRFADGTDLRAQLDDEILERQQKLDEIKKQSTEQQPNVKENKGWLDSIVDSVVGSDELDADHRFALICPRCLNHNGLAPPGLSPEKVRYICPRCGLLNGALVEEISEDNNTREAEPVVKGLEETKEG